MAAHKAKRPRTSKWLFVAATVAIVALQAAGYFFFVRDRVLYNSLSPAEGRFWSADRYERALGLVRQYVYERSMLPPGEERDLMEALTDRWTTNLRTELEVLTNAHELKAFFEQLPDHREVTPLLLQLDHDLDALIAEAMRSQAGIFRLRERFDEVDTAIDRLAIAARVADQQDLTDTLRTYQRGVQMGYFAASAIILAVWFTVFHSLSAARTARRGEEQSKAALAIARKANQEAEAAMQVLKTGAERRMLIHKLNTAVEDERKALSVEIHDVLNAILVRAKLDAQSIAKLASALPPSEPITEIARKAESITKHANDLYAQCRAIVRRLRPEILDVLGLEDAVDEMVRSYNSTAHPGREFSFRSEGNMQTLESSVSIAAYRLIQEALSNCVKHSQASHVLVEMRIDVQRNQLDIVVRDDGIGFDASASTPSVGLIGMRERIDAFNGRLELLSDPETGTTVLATIPLGSPSRS